jgi:hypothetical protein
MIIPPMVELTSETQLVEQRTEQAVCQGRVFPCTQEESAAQWNGKTPKQPHVRSPVLVSEVRFIHLSSGRVHVDIRDLVLQDVRDLPPETGWGRVPTPIF